MTREELLEKLYRIQAACYQDAYACQLVGEVLAYLRDKEIVDTNVVKNYIKANILEVEGDKSWTDPDKYNSTIYKFIFTARAEVLDKTVLTEYVSTEAFKEQCAKNWTGEIFYKLHSLEE